MCVFVYGPMWMPARKRRWFFCVSVVHVLWAHICEFALAVPIVDACVAKILCVCVCVSDCVFVSHCVCL